MWYPVSDEVGQESVLVDEANAHIRADFDDEDPLIDALISAARAHVEAYCNRQFAAHVMTWSCDSFADFRRLPAAPAVEITAIHYVDLAGEQQVLPPSSYILRADGLDPWIARADGAVWPNCRPGARITVTGVFGGACPPDVKQAMLLLIGEGAAERENAGRPVWTAVDALLANHRRGAW